MKIPWVWFGNTKSFESVNWKGIDEVVSSRTSLKFHFVFVTGMHSDTAQDDDDLQASTNLELVELMPVAHRAGRLYIFSDIKDTRTKEIHEQDESELEDDEPWVQESKEADSNAAFDEGYEPDDAVSNEIEDVRCTYSLPLRRTNTVRSQP